MTMQNSPPHLILDVHFLTVNYLGLLYTAFTWIARKRNVMFVNDFYCSLQMFSSTSEFKNLLNQCWIEKRICFTWNFHMRDVKYFIIHFILNQILQFSRRMFGLSWNPLHWFQHSIGSSMQCHLTERTNHFSDFSNTQQCNIVKSISSRICQVTQHNWKLQVNEL